MLSWWRKTRLVCYFPTLTSESINLTLSWIHKQMGRPSFSPPPKKQRLHVRFYDRVRLAVFFHRRFTICTTIFPHPITFWSFSPPPKKQSGERMGRPSFSPPPKKQRLHVYGCVFLRQIQFIICTTVFPHPITYWTRLILNLVRVGKNWAGPVFPHPKTYVN